jgi:hemerythrin-like domain-containing protein
MDAITLLKDQHRDVEKLFKQYESAGDRAFTRKRDLVDRMIESLSKHAAIEEQLFYPVTKDTVPAVADEVLESIEEHHVVKWILSELEKLDVHDERFDAKVTVLIESVRHHVDEEESDYFPKVREALGRKALGELGDAMEQAESNAPTHPHPRGASTPPWNLIDGTVAGVVDRVRDTAVGVTAALYDTGADVVAKVRGTERRSSIAGPPAVKRSARRTSRSIDAASRDALSKVREARATGEDTTDRVRRTAETTARSARTGAVETGKAATAAAKGTVTAAEHAAEGTATAVRAAAKQTAKAFGDAADEVSDAISGATSDTETAAERGADNVAATAKRGATTTRRTARKSAKRTTANAKRQASTSKAASKRGGRSSARSKR